jgi:hypothetical protein
VIVTVPVGLTVPALVSPGVSEKLTVPLEGEVVLTVKGALPKVSVGTELKLSVGVSGATVTVAFTDPAA